MHPILIEEQTFNKINFREEKLTKADYELCSFETCDFSNSDLSNIKFIECEFIDCNLSSSNTHDTAFQNVKFEDCKMLGLQFDKCDSFGFEISLENCQLDHTSSYKMKLNNFKVVNSKLIDVDFTEANLSGVQFETCDLQNAIFERSNLEKCDFRTAFNYSIDPENNRIKAAKFSVEGVSGLLAKYQIVIDNR